MKKILVILDGLRMPVHAVFFACYIASLPQAKLTVLFLEDLEFDEKPAPCQVMGVPYVESIVAGDIQEYAISRFFRQSYADLVIRNLPFSAFITHH